MTFDNDSNPKEYIGDGVYVEFDGYNVILRTDRDDIEHWIMLEPSVLHSLNSFWQHVHDNNKTISPAQEARKA